MDDAALLGQIALGDEEAFDAFYARHRGDVLRQVAAIVRTPAAADDVTQDVFLRVWQRAGQYDARGSARAWLMRTATHMALNALRTIRRRRQTALQGCDPGGDEPAAPPAWMIDEAGAPPDRIVEQEEQRRLVGQMLEGLDPQRRRLLEMVHADDMDLRAVAQELGLPIGTVKSRLHYSRKHLAQAWAARFGPPEETP